MVRPVPHKRMVSMVKSAIADNDKHRPFYGHKAKDYYRGQHDALMYVLEELLGHEQPGTVFDITPDSKLRPRRVNEDCAVCRRK